jgi:hypothetical protein
MPRVRDCYRDGLATTPTLAGGVVVHFAIGPDGHATPGDTRSTLTPEGPSATDVAACVRDVVATLRFPTPADGRPVEVVYPFTFSAASE